MAIVVQSNSAWGKAMAECSPRIVKFLNGLTSERLKNLSAFMLSDGTCLRIDNANQRTFKEQAELYEKGRKAQWTMIPSGASSVVNGGCYALNLDTTAHVTSGWVTNAFAGQSYHNYGLAVDLIWRIDGNNCTKQRFIDTGIVDWAKSCGLAWGGDWANTRGWGPNGDMAHFEDENYRIPVNFNAKQKLGFFGNKEYSYNPNWVDGHDNFKWVCEYNGLSYAKEREKILSEGGSSDGLKPSLIDSAGVALSGSAKKNLNPLLVGIFGGWFLFGRKK